MQFEILRARSLSQMCHINVTAVILQEISQFVVNINTLGEENFVAVESVGVVFLEERLGFGSRR